MYLGMATDTGPAKNIAGGALWRQACTTLKVTGMEGCQMTLLAQKGGAGGHQTTVIGTMRGMAVCTVFSHRRMFPQKGTAFFGMAVKTAIGNGKGSEFRWPGSTVRSMAVDAGHLA